jgi:hypothetical protein
VTALQKKWRITLQYNNDGKFNYSSTEEDGRLAVAVATRVMFVRCPWLEPQTTRINSVRLSPIEAPEEIDEDI